MGTVRGYGLKTMKRIKYVDTYKYMCYIWSNAMKKKTRSILEELDSIGKYYDKKQIIENTAKNVIASVSNLMILIKETYEDDVSSDLEKRLFSSIRTGDEKKFIRGIRKIDDDSNNSTGTKMED